MTVASATLLEDACGLCELLFHSLSLPASNQGILDPRIKPAPCAPKTTLETKRDTWMIWSIALISNHAHTNDAPIHRCLGYTRRCRSLKSALRERGGFQRWKGPESESERARCGYSSCADRVLALLPCEHTIRCPTDPFPCAASPGNAPSSASD